MKKSAIIFIAALLCITISAAAQQQPRSVPNVQEDSVIKIRADLITVLVSVTDPQGKLVNTLTKDDFIVAENGIDQELSTFGRENTLPLRLALLFDTSSSVKPRLKFEQQAAAKFFKEVMRPVDNAALISFNHDVSIVQDFTADVNALTSAARDLKAKGGTALYDAVYLAAEQLEKGQGRRVIVILSDGSNTISRTTLETALRVAERADAVIYGVYTAKRLSPDELGPGFIAGDKELQKICERTGGDVFFPKEIEELDGIFSQLASILRAQYAISFYSNNELRDGSYRALKVSLRNPDLKIRARKGYYAPKD